MQVLRFRADIAEEGAEPQERVFGLARLGRSKSWWWSSNYLEFLAETAIEVKGKAQKSLRIFLAAGARSGPVVEITRVRHSLGWFRAPL